MATPERSMRDEQYRTRVARRARSRLGAGAINLRPLAELWRPRIAASSWPPCATASRPRRQAAWLIALAVLVLCPPRTALALSPAQRVHAQAVESFRLGRFPEAYGRFVQLANAGHPPAASMALWMCGQGPELFGKDWDCTPDEIADWAALAQVPVPPIGPRTYPITAPGAASGRAPAQGAGDHRKVRAAR
jgi:hypothetical protein